MTVCAMCGDNPAAVFTPTMPLCKPCRRDLERMEIEDNTIPNAPTCAVDGTVLNQSGTCPECVTDSIRRGLNQMVRVG